VTTEEPPEVTVFTLDLHTTTPWESISTLEAAADHVFRVSFGDGIRAYDWGVRDLKLYAVFDMDCTDLPTATEETIEDGLRRHFGNGKIVFSCGSLVITMSPHSAAGPDFSSDDSLTANDQAVVIGGSIAGACLIIMVAVLYATWGQGGYSLVP